VKRAKEHLVLPGGQKKTTSKESKPKGREQGEKEKKRIKEKGPPQDEKSKGTATAKSTTSWQGLSKVVQKRKN